MTFGTLDARDDIAPSVLHRPQQAGKAQRRLGVRRFVEERSRLAVRFDTLEKWFNVPEPGTLRDITHLRIPIDVAVFHKFGQVLVVHLDLDPSLDFGRFRFTPDNIRRLRIRVEKAEQECTASFACECRECVIIHNFEGFPTLGLVVTIISGRAANNVFVSGKLRFPDFAVFVVEYLCFSK